MSYKRAHKERRRVSGLCPECGKDAKGGHCCSSCNRIKNKVKQDRENARRKRGLCVRCSEPNPTKLRLCPTCHEDFEGIKLDRKKQLIAKGLCSSCGQKPFLSSMANSDIVAKLCEVCYVKQVSAMRLGTTKHWKLLLKILEEQDGKCPYTGQTIELGINAALDHKFPRSRFPDRKLDPTNMQWTTRLVNSMKLDSTHEEFVELVYHIFSHLQGEQTGDLNEIRPPARF